MTRQILALAIGLAFATGAQAAGTMYKCVNAQGQIEYRQTFDPKTCNQGGAQLNDQGLARLFYNHPIIRSLSDKENGSDRKPSYIPSNQFSTVLLSIILSAGSESALLIYSLYSLPDQLKRIQNPDGSWTGGGGFGSVGPVYTTSIYLTIMQLDKGTLPIYQK